MDLDRGALAKIDRKVVAGLNHDERCQMVRVPASEAVWSTWKRYCNALGVSMGRAIAVLVQHELRSVVEESVDGPAFLAELQDRIVARERALDSRERSLEIREQRLRKLNGFRRDVNAPQPSSEVTKVSRNDPCPCGSGLKSKRCHGQ